jgi:hypothetical protein
VRQAKVNTEDKQQLAAGRCGLIADTVVMAVGRDR